MRDRGAVLSAPACPAILSPMDLSAKELPRTVGRIARIGQRFACVGDAVPNCGAKAQLATFAGRRRKPKDPGCAICLDAQQQATAIAQITGAGRLNLARAEQIPGHFELPHPPAIPPEILASGGTARHSVAWDRL